MEKTFCRSAVLNLCRDFGIGAELKLGFSGEDGGPNWFVLDIPVAAAAPLFLPQSSQSLKLVQV